jgi:hypothetical protein
MSKSDNRVKNMPPIMVRVSKEEGDALREKALDVGKSVPEFLRSCALGRQTRTKVDTHILNELRRLGELQRSLCKENGGALSTEYAAVLLEIISAVRKVGA